MFESIKIALEVYAIGFVIAMFIAALIKFLLVVIEWSARRHDREEVKS